MSDSGGKIELNLFSAEFSQETIKLPKHSFADQEAASAFLKLLPRGTTGFRADPRTDGIDVYLLGPPIENSEYHELKIVIEGDIAKRLIDKSVRDYFSNRGFIVRREFQSSVLLNKLPLLERGDVVIRAGISVSVRRPFEAEPMFFVIQAAWRSNAEFTHNLSDELLRSMALGQSVLFRPVAGRGVTKELRPFIHRRLGTIREFAGANDAVVQCVDHSLRLISVNELYLEAKPNTLTEYDRRMGSRGNPLWIELLKSTFTLTQSGRRNARVLSDRLNAVRAFLATGNDLTLEIPVPHCEGITICVNLKPITASYN